MVEANLVSIITLIRKKMPEQKNGWRSAQSASKKYFSLTVSWYPCNAHCLGLCTKSQRKRAGNGIISQINASFTGTISALDKLLTIKPLEWLTARADGFVIMPYRSGNLGFTGLTAGIAPKPTVLHWEFPVSRQRRLAPLNSALRLQKGRKDLSETKTFCWLEAITQASSIWIPDVPSGSPSEKWLSWSSPRLRAGPERRYPCIQLGGWKSLLLGADQRPCFFIHTGALSSAFLGFHSFPLEGETIPVLGWNEDKIVEVTGKGIWLCGF